MKSFVSRNKYNLLTLLVVFVIFIVIAFLLLPKAMDFSNRLATMRSEVKIAESMQGSVASPDSLIDEYRRISLQIDKYVNNRISSSKILTYIHDAAQKMNVSLHDLSTGDVKKASGKIEIPVSFRMNASFAEMHGFITELENGIYCIRLHDINMNREENDRLTVSVRLSVLSKEGDNE